MLGTLFAAFCILNLLSTLFIFSACTISGREAQMAEAEHAALARHVRIQTALESIRTVHSPHAIAAQAVTQV